jgi:hypothetical protein
MVTEIRIGLLSCGQLRYRDHELATLWTSAYNLFKKWLSSGGPGSALSSRFREPVPPVIELNIWMEQIDQYNVFPVVYRLWLTERTTTINIASELLPCLLRLFDFLELYNTWALWSGSIVEDLGQNNLTGCLEQFYEIFIRGRPWQLNNE